MCDKYKCLIAGVHSRVDGILQLRSEWRRWGNLSSWTGTRSGDRSDGVDGRQNVWGIHAESDRQSTKHVYIYQSINRANAPAGKGFFTGSNCKAIDRAIVVQGTGRRLDRELQWPHGDYRRHWERLLQVMIMSGPYLKNNPRTIELEWILAYRYCYFGIVRNFYNWLFLCE